MVSISVRQDDPLAVPTANGISAVGVTAGNASPSVGSLALDDAGTAAAATPTDVGVVGGTLSTPLNTGTPSSASSSATPSSSNSQERFSIGVVVGICVGALAGAVAIVLIGVLIYRRQNAHSRRRGPPAPLSQTRRRSREWGKLEGGHDPDHWEGKYPATKQISPNSVAPMEKLTMFKKSPSVRSGFTHKSDNPTSDASHNLSEYHPGLAKELAMQEVEGPKTRPFLARVDTGPALSWDSSGLSFNSGADGGRMSPMFNKAIPTPPAMDIPLHHAQSAEVIDFDGQTAEIVNPFEDGPTHPPPVHAYPDIERRKSKTGNPFFGSRSDRESMSVSRSRSRATSTVSAASSHYTDYMPPKVDKGKARAIDPASSHGHGDEDMYASEDEDLGYYSATSNVNPFSDPPETPTTPSQFTNHLAPDHPYAAPIFRTSSPRALPETPNTPVNDATAIKGLLAALDIGDVRNQNGDTRLTVTSVGSAYSDVSATAFPSPPPNAR